MKRHTVSFRRSCFLLACFIVLLTMLPACGSGAKYHPNEGVATKIVTDDTGRNVEVAETITRIAPSGATAQMFLMPLASDMLVGLSASPSTMQRPYFPEEMWYLPTFGQMYGSKSTLNLEALVAAQPQLIIDTGDRKVTIAADMNSIEKRTGIPAVFFEATLECMPSAYRQLGAILGREEEAEELAQFIEKTLAMAAEKSSQIPEADKKTVMFGTGATGLAVNADESSQAQVIDLIGAKNAIIPDTVTDKGGGTIINLESVYVEDPDVILFTDGGPYDQVAENEWSELRAIQEGSYYEIPGLPYCWMSSPPSVNMVLGVWWCGQVVYPEIYNDYDMVQVAQEFYRLFWHYDLSEEEAMAFLANSIYK